jgi:hypothetical protein
MTDDQRWPLARDGLAVVSIGASLFLLVLLALPSEGSLAAPLRAGLWAALGRAALAIPLVLLLLGLVTLTRSVAPGAALPRARLVGLAILAASALPAQDFVESGASGSVGHVLGTGMVGLVGGPGAALLLVLGLIVGTLLTFDVAFIGLLRFNKLREDEGARN